MALLLRMLMREHFAFLIAGAVAFGAPTCAQAGFLDALARAAMKVVGGAEKTAPKTLPKATAPLATPNPHAVPPGKLPGQSPESAWRTMPNDWYTTPKLDWTAPEKRHNWRMEYLPKDEGTTALGAESSVGDKAHTKGPVEYGAKYLKDGSKKVIEEGGKQAIENVLEEPPGQETDTEYPHQ